MQISGSIRCWRRIAACGVVAVVILVSFGLFVASTDGRYQPSARSVLRTEGWAGLLLS
jgi:hypothetical protein